MIRNENGQLAGYVFVDMAGRDIGGYVEEAKGRVQQMVRLPTGYALVWSGQWENMERVKKRLTVIVPLTIFLIAMLLYMNTKSAVKAGIVLLAVPFSLVGAVWLLWFLGYNISTAVWVGMIALMGLDAETGVFMLLFLDLAYEERVRAGRMRTYADLEDAIIHGAVRRIRPKAMTVTAMFMGLLPIMWSVGSGADMMKRVAGAHGRRRVHFVRARAARVPVLYSIWKWRFVMKKGTSSRAQHCA
jgi:Cu(I)/Ag(I) efflux system membrane protein CusA/SilA